MILCSGTLGGVPFVDKARAAAAAGFDGISIYAREHEPGLRAVLDDLGLAVAEVDGAMKWLPDQVGMEPTRFLDIAAELGARSVTVLDTTYEPVDPGLAADAFGVLCDRAVPLGVVVHLEPFAWSGIATLAAATEILARAGHTNGGLLFDTWHHARGPDRGVLDAAAVEWIVAIQVSDPAPDPLPSLPEDCMHNRRWPGPVARSMVAELRALGCDAPLEVEVFTDGSDPAAQARAAYDALSALARPTE